jgi:hypothetical protein
MQPITHPHLCSPAALLLDAPARHGELGSRTNLRRDTEAARMRAEAAPHKAFGAALPVDFEAAA